YAQNGESQIGNGAKRHQGGIQDPRARQTRTDDQGQHQAQAEREYHAPGGDLHRLHERHSLRPQVRRRQVRRVELPQLRHEIIQPAHQSPATAPRPDKARESCSTMPCRIRTTRSKYSWANCCWCSEHNKVNPLSSASLHIRESIWRLRSGSSEATGSAASSSLGCCTSARAIA